ncbi:MAG: hypothetical protein WBV74_20790, partial [Pseudonocardiaceae bacterium]
MKPPIQQGCISASCSAQSGGAHPHLHAECLQPHRESFLVTTYHPDTDDSGFGGTDHLVTTALARLGITDSDVAELFA